LLALRQLEPIPSPSSIRFLEIVGDYFLYFTRFVRLPLFAGQSQKRGTSASKNLLAKKSETPGEFPSFSL